MAGVTAALLSLLRNLAQASARRPCSSVPDPVLGPGDTVKPDPVFGFREQGERARTDSVPRAVTLGRIWGRGRGILTPPGDDGGCDREDFPGEAGPEG